MPIVLENLPCRLLRIEQALFRRLIVGAGLPFAVAGQMPIVTGRISLEENPLRDESLYKHDLSLLSGHLDSFPAEIL